MKMKSKIFVKRRRLLMEVCSSMTSLLAALSCIVPRLVTSFNVDFSCSMLTSSGVAGSELTAVTSVACIVDMGDIK